MPLIGITYDGTDYTIEQARSLFGTRDTDLRYTPELFEAIIATRQERDYISTTTLTSKCLRQKAIQGSEPYYEDLDKMWAAFRGTMFHGQLERHATIGAFEEARFFITMPNGIELSGSPDLVDVNTGILYDYKFTKEVPRWNTPWPDHGEQCNVNRYLVDHAERVTYRGKTYTGKDVDQFRPAEWTDLVLVYMDDRGPKPLRVTKSIDIPKADGKGTKKARVSDIWSDEQAEEYILNRFTAANDALNNGNLPPAPAGWEYQSHALCGYCPVKRECAAAERAGV